MLLHTGTRCSHRPKQTSAPAARYTSRTRYSSPRQRRNPHALARWPIACSTSARSPAWQRLNARCASLSRSLVRRSPTGAAGARGPWPCRGTPGPPGRRPRRRPAPHQAPTAQAAPARGSCPASPHPPTAGHPRWWTAPGPGRCGVPLGVIQDLLVGPPGWPLHPDAQPVHPHRLAGFGHLLKQRAQVLEGGDKRAVGLAEPQAGQRAEQQVQAVADLGLGDPDRPARAPVRQPVQDDRPDRVQAHLQRQRRGAAPPGRAGRGEVGEAGGQPGQHLGGQRGARAV